MPLDDQSLPWQFDPYDPYFSITYEGVAVGLCTMEFATRIVEVLNEEGKLRKALELACFDLLRQSGGDPERVAQLVQKYIERTERPKYGTRAIAFLLRDRQEELDISDKAFVRFCDSYKLSAEELQDIYEGKDISNSQLVVLSRILGKTVEELAVVRDGIKEADND